MINIPHNNVYIIWDNPDWVRWVIHIPVSDDNSSKYINVLNKYRMIINIPELSEDFIFMNDDMYIMSYMDDIQYYISWTLIDRIENQNKLYWENVYYNTLYRVYEKYPNWDSFAVHVPIKYNKEKLKKLINSLPDIEIDIRSLYWNTYNIKWIKLDNNTISDCKVFLNDRVFDKWKNFLSSDDSTIRNMWFIRYMNNIFPYKCKYEI